MNIGAVRREHCAEWRGTLPQSGEEPCRETAVDDAGQAIRLVGLFAQDGQQIIPVPIASFVHVLYCLATALQAWVVWRIHRSADRLCSAKTATGQD